MEGKAGLRIAYSNQKKVSMRFLSERPNYIDTPDGGGGGHGLLFGQKTNRQA